MLRGDCLQHISRSHRFGLDRRFDDRDVGLLRVFLVPTAHKIESISRVDPSEGNSDCFGCSNALGLKPHEVFGDAESVK